MIWSLYLSTIVPILFNCKADAAGAFSLSGSDSGHGENVLFCSSSFGSPVNYSAILIGAINY